MPKVALSKFHMPKFLLTKFHMPKVLYAKIPIAKIHWSLSNFLYICIRLDTKIEWGYPYKTSVFPKELSRGQKIVKVGLKIGNMRTKSIDQFKNSDVLNEHPLCKSEKGDALTGSSFP